MPYRERPWCTSSFDARLDGVVGRHHARIVRSGEDPRGFVLSDLSSRNGTFLNGDRVWQAVPLTSGDRLQLGHGGPELEFQVE